MRTFTIEVYNCTHCPHADHDREECILAYDGRVVEYLPEAEDELASRLYSENCLELCDSCPRLE